MIPAHDSGKYLASAIESVRTQAAQDWECVVVDDGSTDETSLLLDRIAAADPRVTYLMQTHRGVSAARNAGLRAARGALVQFLDADDLLAPWKLETHASILHEHDEVDVVVGPTAYFDGDSTGVPSTWRPDPTSLLREGDESPRRFLEQLLGGNRLTVEAPLVRRTLLERLGGFDERLTLMEDWEMWLRAALAGARFLYVPSTEPAALVRVHGASASYDKLPMLKSEIAIRTALADVLPDRGYRALNRRYLEEARARAGEIIGFRGSPLLGLRYLVPAAVALRRPAWLRVSAKLLLAMLPGGSRLARALRAPGMHEGPKRP